MNCSFAGMNFLGHAYLSFNSRDIIIGNMISDFVKGRAQFGFSGNIHTGIKLHRDIDTFTDDHPATKKAKEIFRSHYRLYSGALMDIVYDHYLATDENLFTELTLKEFTNGIYQVLEQRIDELPFYFRQAFTYMKTEDWLFHYRTREGIRKSMAGMVRRSKFLTESHTAFQLFNEHYDFLKDCYQEFFPDVKQYAKERLQQLNA